MQAGAFAIARLIALRMSAGEVRIAVAMVFPETIVERVQSSSCLGLTWLYVVEQAIALEVRYTTD
ncbi:hypothetical protein D3C75_1018470 [compost metagenome]